MKAFIDYETARYSGFVDFRKAMLSTVSPDRRLSPRGERLSGFQSFDDLMKAEAGDHWLLHIADAAVDHVSAAVQGVLDWLSAQAGAVVAAMASGPVAASQAVGNPPSDDITTALAAPFAEAGHQQVTEIKDGSDKRIDFNFDVRNPKVTDFLQTYAMGLIQQITDDQRQSIHDIVTEGAKSGASTDAMARQIRNGLGLTAAQAGWVDAYEQELRDGDPGALERQLRDQRSDSKVQRAIDGEALSEDDITRLVGRYSDRVRSFRAETVARTESLRSAQLGAFSSMVGMLDDPSMEGMTIAKTWLATKDKRTREAHRECDGETVIGPATPFSNGLIIPHDDNPDTPADQVINCRCTCKFRIVRDPDQ